MAGQTIRVYKLDAYGQAVWHYDGTLVHRDSRHILLEARFTRDYTTPYHHFRQDDRMLEWFFADRWYNIFQMHSAEDDALRGWYCNVTRPARLLPNAVYAEDLALDLMVYPDGRYIVLDEEEFTDLKISAEDQAQARAALARLIAMVEAGEGIFAPLRQP